MVAGYLVATLLQSRQSSHDLSLVVITTFPSNNILIFQTSRVKFLYMQLSVSYCVHCYGGA